MKLLLCSKYCLHFRLANLACGKLLVCDEAHKYFNKKEKLGFTKTVTEAVRLMRHEGMRIIISSQSPEKIPIEMMELATLTVLHPFVSVGWLNYLRGIYNISDEDFNEIMNLSSGEALIHARGFQGQFQKLCIRKKLT